MIETREIAWRPVLPPGATLDLGTTRDTLLFFSGYGLGEATGISTGAPTVGNPALAEADDDDNLTATGISTGAPSLGTPSIGQVHLLTATGTATGAPALAAPTFGQAHALTATGISAAPEVGSPALAEKHALTATGVSCGAPELGAPDLVDLGSGDHLTATGISTGPELAAPECFCYAPQVPPGAESSRTARLLYLFGRR